MNRRHLTLLLLPITLWAAACQSRADKPTPSPLSVTQAGPTAPITILRPADVAVPRYFAAVGSRLLAIDDQSDSTLMNITDGRIESTTHTGSTAFGMYADSALGIAWVVSSTGADAGIVSAYDSSTLNLVARVTLPTRGVTVTYIDGTLVVGAIGKVYQLDPHTLALTSTIASPLGLIGPFEATGIAGHAVALAADTEEKSSKVAQIDLVNRSVSVVGQTLTGTLSVTSAKTHLWLTNTASGATTAHLISAPLTSPAQQTVAQTISAGASVWLAGGQLWTYEPAIEQLICRNVTTGAALANITAGALLTGPGIAAGPVAIVTGKIYFAAATQLQYAPVPNACSRGVVSRIWVKERP